MSQLRFQMSSNERQTPDDLVDRRRKTKGSLRPDRNFTREDSGDRDPSNATDGGAIDSNDSTEIPELHTYPTGVERVGMQAEGGLLAKPVRKTRN